ncbi:MAG: phosphopyruvate hydratase, partial [Thermoplasmata archaeon]
MSSVERVGLRSIYDSRGHPTVEATVTARSGVVGRAASPSGASTGVHEVRAFPEGGVPETLTRFGERERASLAGTPLGDQPEWDRRLHDIDGTPDLSRLGGNTTTALSLAYSLAGAAEAKQPLWS